MGGFVRALSPRAEFAIVVVGAFGVFVLASLIWMFNPPSAAPITEQGLVGLVEHELIVLLVLGWFLRERGWRLDALGFSPDLKNTQAGLALALAAYLAYLASWALAALLVPSLGSSVGGDGLVGSSPRLAAVVAISIVNPIFEELFVAGYVISFLKRSRGFWFAVNVSLAIRLLYHLYQGPAGVVGTIPIGWVFGFWYAYTGRLWPLVVAHGLFDFLALAVR
jgi:membrane protease YdiL (CAAX protease family)